MDITLSNLPIQTGNITCKPLWIYVIASSDMWYSEINQREIFLINDPERGLVIRGEIPGYGPACHADLCQILLEISLTCQSYKDNKLVENSATSIGDHLGKVLGSQFNRIFSELSTVDKLIGSFKCIFKSMKISFGEMIEAGSIQYSLPECPILASAKDSGYKLEVELARKIFGSLCLNMAKSLAPNWKLHLPTTEEVENPPFRIILSANQAL